MKATVTGGKITLEYHEPTTNSDGTVNTDGSANNDGSALTDLDHTTIYMDGVKVKDVPASAPTGGGLITETLDSGVTAGREKNVIIAVGVWDGSGNESPHSAPLTVRVDRLAPASAF